jgi:hypothetical protein
MVELLREMRVNIKEDTEAAVSRLGNQLSERLTSVQDDLSEL